MGAIHLLSRLISAWFAFVLPGFRTFQALQHRPTSDQDVECWSKYWVIMSFVVALEYTIEWLVSWFPFYWEIRTLFLLFLSLPQIQGSTFVYDSYVGPFLTRNEVEFDQQITLAKTNIFAFFASRISSILDKVTKSAGISQATTDPATGKPNANGAAMKMAMNIWKTVASPYIGHSGNNSSPAVSSSPASSMSSTAVQSVDSLSRKNGYSPEVVSLPVTPDDIHRAHQTPDVETDNAPPSFPIPQHFE